MTALEHLYRISDYIGTNIAFDFFDWDKLQGEISHFDLLDDHTLDMIQAQVVQAASPRTELGLTVPADINSDMLLELVNYLGLFVVRPPAPESLSSRAVIEKNFPTKQQYWGKDMHLLLTFIIVFDKSDNYKLKKSVYVLADLAVRALREGRVKGDA